MVFACHYGGRYIMKQKGIACLLLVLVLLLTTVMPLGVTADASLQDRKDALSVGFEKVLGSEEKKAERFEKGYVWIRKGKKVFSSPDRSGLLGTFAADAVAYAEIARESSDPEKEWLKITFDTKSAREKEKDLYTGYIQYSNVKVLSKAETKKLDIESDARQYKKHPLPAVKFDKAEAKPTDRPDAEGTAEDESNGVNPKSIKITGSKYVAKGKKITLTAKVLPAKASQKVEWSSSDTNIASVSSKGVVKGIQAGDVIITATSKANNKVSRQFTVHVMPKAVSKVTISGAGDINLADKKTLKLKATAKPKEKAAQSFTWTSSDPEIAKVSAKGKVTAVKEGEVTITATATDGSNKKKSVTIKVLSANYKITTETENFGDFSSETIGMINAYNGTIAPVPGYERYDLARLIVKPKKSLPVLEAYNPVKIISSSDVKIIQFTNPVDAKNCADYLQANDFVEYADPDQVEKAIGDYTATSRSYSWGVSAIHADIYAQSLLARGIRGNVTVAVVDTGVDTTHPLIRSSVSGYDAVDGDNVPQDAHGHGTHVSGTIMDVTSGMNVSIMPVRVLGADGYGTSIQVSLGIQYAAQNGADVINLSLGGGHNQYIDEAVQYALNKGVTVVIAAGNDSINASGQCPAHIGGAITVSAVDQNMNLASFSNYGGVIDLAAPGVGITSSVPGGGYEAWNGTSMATPHVAGAAALLLCEFPGLSPSGVAAKLKEAALDIGPAGNDNSFGAGLVDLIAFAQGIVTPTPEPTVTPTPEPTAEPTPVIPTGSISGKVLSAQSREPISGAEVLLYKDGSFIQQNTTDAQGNYTVDNVQTGSFRIKISATGHVPFEGYGTVRENETTYMETFLIVQGEESQTGTAVGTIFNAFTGANLEGASLSVRNGWNNSGSGSTVAEGTTGSEGGYSFDLPIGNYTITAAKEGFTTSSFNIIVIPDVETRKDFGLTPLNEIGNYRFKLTWGQDPRDLDSHVYAKLADGSSFHVFFSDMNAYVNDELVCNLDVDDTTSYGPEVVTLKAFDDATYYYYVHLYAGDGTLPTSEARVEVYEGPDLIRTFNISTEFAPEIYWNVFRIKNGTLSVRNTMSAEPEIDY